MSQASASMQRIGRRILDARTAAELTQQQLADRTGWTRSAVANVEGGRQGLDAVQLALAARALRVTLDDLIRPEDLPPEPVLPAAPHAVDVRVVYEVTCRTCPPGELVEVTSDKGQALQARKDHVAEMLAKESGGAP